MIYFFNIVTAPKPTKADAFRHYVLLLGESGTVFTPHRVAVGYWCPDKERWLTHDNGDFTDDGGEPPHWAPWDVKLRGGDPKTARRV